MRFLLTLGRFFFGSGTRTIREGFLRKFVLLIWWIFPRVSGSLLATWWSLNLGPFLLRFCRVNCLGVHLRRTHFRLTMRTHIPCLYLGPRSPLLHLPRLLLWVRLVVGVSGWLLCRTLLLMGITMKVGILGKLLLP